MFSILLVSRSSTFVEFFMVAAEMCDLVDGNL